MEDRALLKKATFIKYDPAEWTGENKSGINPVGNRVLVLGDSVANMTEGGIALTEEYTYRHTLAAEAGVVIAVGEGAFKWNSDKVTPFEGRAPAPGDRVCIERYSGQLIRGDDDQMYRLMECYCVGAVITENKK